MSNQEMGWEGPMEPWEIIQKRFFGGQAPEVSVFAQKHNLSETEVQKVFSGEEVRLSPELCKALSTDTGMSFEFFKNLSDRYQQRVTA